MLLHFVYQTQKRWKCLNYHRFPLEGNCTVNKSPVSFSAYSGQVRILTNDEDDVDSKEEDSDGCEFYGPARPPQGNTLLLINMGVNNYCI